MLLLFSGNTQSFVHDKSSFTSHFIKNKLRDLQEIIIYLSGIEILISGDDTAACAG